MKQIKISDATMRQVSEGFRLSFKEKIELSKLLDKLGVDLIELEGIKNPRIDALQINSIVAAVNDSRLAVPVELLNNEAALKAAQLIYENYCSARDAKARSLFEDFFKNFSFTNIKSHHKTNK